MNVVPRIALAAGLVLACVFPGESQAGWGVVKPDLVIQLIGPSLVSATHARVVIANLGPAASGTCVLRLAAQIPNPTLLHFHTIPAIPACTNIWAPPTVAVDVNLSGASPLTPGQVIQGFVDAFGQVDEKNENNNGYWYGS